MMSTKLDNLETVWEGWLTKSPPTTRIWRARWRRRWFILRNSGELPGQYFLCYYTDRNCRKLKGQIDLDQCEQVDAGLRFESNKQKYQHMFTIRTPKRTYYLAAESEEDMNKWVDCVCHVCGLKPFLSEDPVTEYEGDDISQATTGITEISPPVTPSTIITGPYIPISECISGKPINSAEDLRQFLLVHGPNNTKNHHTTTSPSRATTTLATTVAPSRVTVDSYDLPRNLRPPPQVETNTEGSTPPPSPGSESVFTDDESTSSVKPRRPAVNWETFPRPSDSSMDGEESPGLVTTASNVLTLKADRKFAKVASPNAPPRPPKPSHLAGGETQATQEETKTTDSVVADDMYDIPRSHQIIISNDAETVKRSASGSGRHCYSNAAPGHMGGDNNVFRYDFVMTVSNAEETPDSPGPSTMVTTPLAYPNVPSPSYSIGGTQQASTPPLVNRDLKPGRKCSDSTGGSNEPSPILATAGYHGPIIDRNKKPMPAKTGQQLKKIQESGSRGTMDNSIVLCSPPVGSLNKRKQRGTPSQTTANNVAAVAKTGFATTSRMHRRHSSSDDRLAPNKEEVQVFQVINKTYQPRSHRKTDTSKKFSEIQYLDLDLESSNKTTTSNSYTTGVGGLVKKSSENVHTPSTATVYKTVDFLKTEAFNRTRIEIEEERNRLCMAAESAL